MKQFFKLVKYEFKRVKRNKFVMSMLLCFSIIMLTMLSFVNVKDANYPVAIYLDGQRVEDVDVFDLIYEEISDKSIIYVDSEDEGLEKLKKNKVCFFISLNSSDNPVTATFYYDSSSSVGRSIKGNLSEKKGEYTYKVTSEFLSDFGINVNEAYFNSVTFKSATKKEVNVRQVPFAIEVASFVSIILMFGLAYSMSRDNETKVSRNIAYMPIGINKYLWSKIIPYFILGMVEFVIVYLLGGLLFNIDYQLNPIIMILISSLFILATIMIGLLFSTCSSQIATIFLDMGVLLIPVFGLMMTFIQTLFLPFKVIILAMPMTPFVLLLNGMMYNGVIIWFFVILLALLSLVYYFLTVYVMNRKLVKHKL